MLMQLLIMLDALKSESPHRITVAPRTSRPVLRGSRRSGWIFSRFSAEF